MRMIKADIQEGIICGVGHINYEIDFGGVPELNNKRNSWLLRGSEWFRIMNATIRKD